jgi:hypothetical protein
VESGIFYAAIFEGDEGVSFNPEFILERENIFEAFLPAEKEWGKVIHVAKTDKLTLYSDITCQRLVVSE